MVVTLTVLTGTALGLHCGFLANETATYVWEDTSTNTTLFTVRDNVTKTEEAKGSRKYDNFDIFSQFPLATTLEITNTALDDYGTYSCYLLNETSTPITFVVQVEGE